MIRASNLGFAYKSGRIGLVAVDLDVAPGELIALVGPNGSGKTTLLRLLAGDLQPTAGSLSIDRHTTRGFAGAQTVHFEELTGLENAGFFGRAQRAPASSLQRQLSAFNLLADADTATGEYSFGMQRKLLLVEALAHEPALVLLDEPTIGLDPAALDVLNRELAARVQDGATVMLGTHDVRTAVLATRVVFLHRGRKIADAAPQDLLRSVRSTTRIEVRLAAEPVRQPDFPAAIAAVRSVDGYWLESGDATHLPAVCAALMNAGARIHGIQLREPNLADVFMRLTGEVLESSAMQMAPSDA